MVFGLFTSGDKMIDDLLDAIIVIIILGTFIFLGSPFYNSILKGAF